MSGDRADISAEPLMRATHDLGLNALSPEEVESRRAKYEEWRERIESVQARAELDRWAK